MRISSITKNAGKACNNRLYRHIRTFEKIVKNYFVIFTKFIQRYTKYYGIEYRSSKSDATDNNKAVVRDRCYVLFATNRDCIDECERAVKLDQKRLQMIMKTYVQV